METPPLDDVITISHVLTSLGAIVTFDQECIRINASHLISSKPNMSMCEE